MPDGEGNVRTIERQAVIGTGTAPVITDIGFDPGLQDGKLPAGTQSATITVSFNNEQNDVVAEDVQATFDGVDVSGDISVDMAAETVTYTATGLKDKTEHTFNVTLADRGDHTAFRQITFAIAGTSGGGGGGGGGGQSASVDVTPGPNGVAIDILSGAAGQTAWADLTTLETNGVTFDRYGIEFERGASASVTVDAMATQPKGTSELAGALGYLRVDERYVMSSTIDKSRVRVTVSKDALPDGASMNDVTVYHYHEGEWRPVWTFHDGQTITGIEPRIAPLAIGVESGNDGQGTTTMKTTDAPDSKTQTSDAKTQTSTTSVSHSSTTIATDEPMTSSDGQPGFGIVVALAALLALVGLRRYD
ncbi:PGF-CTERM sorting domain-containing protein [Haladaptatus sp. NG-SE-30]